MKYANGACCPWLQGEKADTEEYCYDDVDFMNLKPAKKPQQVQTPGMAYVPMQVWKKPYEMEIGFQRGTIFHALDKPFLGDEGAF